MSPPKPPSARLRPVVLTRAAVVVLVVLVIAGLVVVPMLFLLRGALAGGGESVAGALGNREVREALWHTVSLAIVATVAAVAGGTALAMAFDRSMVRRPAGWRIALVLPLLVPQFALTLSWAQAYGPGGLSDQLLGLPLPGLYGPTGVALLLTADAVPLVWLVVAAGLAVRREPDLVRAARASGAGPWRTFATIDLPLLRGPLLAAGAVVFVGVVNAFAVPQVLGSTQGYQTLATLAYQQLSLSAAPDAFARLCSIALLMVALVLVAIGGADRGLGRVGPGFARSGPGGARFTHRASTGTRLVTAGLVAYLALTTALPLVALMATSLTRAPGLPPVPANWTVQNYTAGLGPTALASLGRTATLAAGAAVVVTILAAVVVGLGGSSRRRLGTALTLGYAMPGTALAIGVLVAYGPWLGGSAAIILLAYLGKCAALGYRALAAGADRVAPELGQAARVSGADPATVYRTITAPVMSTGYLAAAGLVVLFAVHELTMSSILYGADTQ
nr:ABC transporter permease subunit [Actinomycetota bacterium]